MISALMKASTYMLGTRIDDCWICSEVQEGQCWKKETKKIANEDGNAQKQPMEWIVKPGGDSVDSMASKRITTNH